MNNSADEKPITTSQLADFLQVTPQTVSNYLKDIRFPSTKVGGEYRFYKSKVMNYFEGLKVNFSIAHPIGLYKDSRIIKMRDTLDNRAYGFYWLIMEYLACEVENRLPTDYENLAIRLNKESPNDLVDSKYLKSMIENFDLFKIKDDFFYSKDLMFMEKDNSGL